MSFGFEGIRIEGGKIEIGKDGREVATTNGTLLYLLPTSVSYTRNVNFPDLKKTWAYLWRHSEEHEPISDVWLKSNQGNSYISVVPQEYSDVITLGSVPSGADFFAGRVRINRTTSPSDTWFGQTLSVLVVQNQWIPFMGGTSIMLEADAGFMRMASIYIDGGSLVLRREQSVSVAPGGWGSFVLKNEPFDKEGGTWEYGDKKGLPVKLRASASTNAVSDIEFPITNRRYGHIDAVTTSDNTDYKSTYSFEIIGRYGRRS